MKRKIAELLTASLLTELFIQHSFLMRNTVYKYTEE